MLEELLKEWGAAADAIEGVLRSGRAKRCPGIVIWAGIRDSSASRGSPAVRGEGLGGWLLVRPYGPGSELRHGGRRALEGVVGAARSGIWAAIDAPLVLSFISCPFGPIVKDRSGPSWAGFVSGRDLSRIPRRSPPRSRVGTNPAQIAGRRRVAPAAADHHPLQELFDHCGAVPTPAHQGPLSATRQSFTRTAGDPHEAVEIANLGRVAHTMAAHGPGRFHCSSSFQHTTTCVSGRRPACRTYGRFFCVWFCQEGFELISAPFPTKAARAASSPCSVYSIHAVT